MAKKLYQLLLDPQRAKRMTMHLRNLRLDYSSSEVGGVFCLQIFCLDSDIKDVRACLDEIVFPEKIEALNFEQVDFAKNSIAILSKFKNLKYLNLMLPH